MKIRKAVIPAAGLGTRFLPATKAMPKEMLPIVDKPTIQYIVEEAIAAGIQSILIITGRSKRAIEDHFDRNIELEIDLKEKGKNDLLKIVEDISNMVNVTYIRQKTMAGLGDAVYCAKDFIGNEPFAVLLGDDIMVSKEPAIKQLMDVYENTGKSVVGVMEVAKKDVNKYGIVDVSADWNGVFQLRDLVEKPETNVAPSNLAIMGRYVLTADVFDMIKQTKPGVKGEIQLTDALRSLREKQGMCAVNLQGKRYDVGDKLGFLKATCEFALEREDLKDDFKKYLEELLEK